MVECGSPKPVMRVRFSLLVLIFFMNLRQKISFGLSLTGLMLIYKVVNITIPVITTNPFGFLMITILLPFVFSFIVSAYCEYVLQIEP